MKVEFIQKRIITKLIENKDNQSNYGNTVKYCPDKIFKGENCAVPVWIN